MELVAILVIGYLILNLAASSKVSGAVETWWAALFRGVRPDPWPRGVQEEDRDRPWGSAPVAIGGRGALAGPDAPRREDPEVPVVVALEPVRRR